MPTTDQLDDGLKSTTARAMAQHAVLAALVRLHPEPQKLRDLIEQFAEAHRVTLLNSMNWSDEQVARFDRGLEALAGTLPPPSSKSPR